MVIPVGNVVDRDANKEVETDIKFFPDALSKRVLIEPGETAETVRYSWRGLFYLYFQLVKDMVRMC